MSPSGATISDLRCEYLRDPLGLETARPRFQWRINSGTRGDRQTAYQIQAAASLEKLRGDRGDLWDTSRVDSAQSVQVEYAGSTLSSGATVFWRVRIWDVANQCSLWSEPSTFSVGLLRQEDWEAQWIGMDSASTKACPWLRKSFALEAVPASALAYIGSIGYHELYVNGQKADDRVLAPSVSDLRKRALYGTYDIRPLLRTGQNVIALWLAPGWAQFRDFNPGQVDFQVEKPAIAIAQLHLGAPCGPFEKILSDGSWRCSPSTTIHLGEWHNGNFGGDRVDGNLDQPGWSDAGFDDGGWEQAGVYHPGRELSSDWIEPNRRCETIVVEDVSRPSPEKCRFVMAKLFAGWIEFTVSGTPGQHLTILASSRPEVDVEYEQKDELVLGPSGQGTFCNRFSYHLIHTVTVEGLDANTVISDVTGYRISNDRERTGEFTCSDPLLNQIHDYTVDTYLNLCTGGMTVDCPHRERLGYGGDGHNSLEIALDTVASAPFLTKWAQDWCDNQEPDGRIPHTAPTMGGGGGPGWSGFVLAMPWEVYRAYGDRRILERTYPHGSRWLEYLQGHRESDGLLTALPGGYWLFLGDWAAPGRHEGSETPEALLFNNCYFLYAIRLAAKFAEVLGCAADVSRWEVEASALKGAINRRFLDPKTGAYLDTRQTHCLMPLIAGAVPLEHLEQVTRNLEHEILVNQAGHLDTGLHGTYFLTKYLTETNRSDLLYTIASQTTAPGYGDLIAHGYRTWPEDWAGSISRLHGCYNGIGGWFLRGLAGIRTDDAHPGFEKFRIEPAVVGDLKWVRASFESPYGRIESNWTREGERLTLEIRVPVNTSATVVLPARDPGLVTESGMALSHAAGLEIQGFGNGEMVLGLGSGHYQFAVNDVRPI